MPRPASAQRLLLFAPSPDLIAPTPPAPFVPQLQSIDFDGTTEEMASAGTQLMGIANTWTIAQWLKFDNVSTGVGGTILGISNSPGSLVNSIQLFHRNDAFGPRGLQFLLHDSAATTIQNVRWANTLFAGIWHHVVIQWAGTPPSRKMFLDGIERGATTTTTSSSGTLTDTARLYSTSRSLSGVGRFDGREGSIAIFDSILSAAEVLAIRNDGDIDFDLKANQGDYQSAANLVHWNPLGAKVSPLLGEDIA